MAVTEGKVSGKLVIEAVNVSKAYGGRTVVRDLSMRVARGDRIGIVGANGTGKTTLLGLLTGQLAPDEGTVRLGANLEMVTLDQRREDLDPDETLTDALTGGGDTVFVAGERKHVVSYMKDFLFSPEQARTPISRLSGGERGRLMLARALARPSNLLVLDEPTNDLDLETLDLLQEMIADYPGTVLVVSHDRDFLDRVVTSVIAHDGDGRWVDYAGGYSDMIAQRGRGEAPPAAMRTGRGRGPSAPGAAAPSSARKRKLSFKEKHALETLPERISALQAEAAALQARLADPMLYAEDPARFAVTATALETARAALDAAEEEWLALEMLREELEGA
jgi:ATP-binding cassette subfamily F protein uup